MKINIIELEKILLANWTAFLNPREIISFITAETTKNNETNDPISSLTVSRFELTQNGFLIWIDFKSNNKQTTLEVLLKLNGEIKLLSKEVN